MTKADRTRQHIIERTAPLFNKKGFDGTSLADLTAATGLTKGALYGNFSDKDEIAREAFQYAVAKVRASVEKSLEGKKSYRQQLLALFGFFAEYVTRPPVPGGCPLLNAAVEVDDHRVSMRRMVGTELVAVVTFIERLIRNGVQAGEFRRETRPRELAYTFFCCIEGAMMFSRVARSTEAMDIVITHCKEILNKISQ